MITFALFLLIVTVGIILLSISPVLLMIGVFIGLDVLMFKALFGKKKRKEKNQKGEV